MPGVETARERYERLRGEFLQRIRDGIGSLAAAAFLEELVEAHSVMVEDERFGVNEREVAYRRREEAKPMLARYGCACGHGLFVHYSVLNTGGPLACRNCPCEEYERAEEPASVRVPRAKYRPLEFGPLPEAPKLDHRWCVCGHYWDQHKDNEPHACVARDGRHDCDCQRFSARQVPIGDGAAFVAGGPLPPVPSVEPDYGGDRVELFNDYPKVYGERNPVYGREPPCADCKHGRRWHEGEGVGCIVPVLDTNAPDMRRMCHCPTYRWPSQAEVESEHPHPRIDYGLANLIDETDRLTQEEMRPYPPEPIFPARSREAAEEYVRQAAARGSLDDSLKTLADIPHVGEMPEPSPQFRISDAIARRMADAFDRDVEGRDLPPYSPPSRLWRLVPWRVRVWLGRW